MRPSWFPSIVALLLALAAGCGGLRDWDDADGDGWVNLHDCAPRDARVHPDAAEICGDDRDNNCNGLQDEFCEDMSGLTFHELCGVNTRGEVICWQNALCGVNDAGEVICWDPSRNLPLLDPQLSMAEFRVWRRYGCGRTAFGEIDCVSPLEVAALELPDGSEPAFVSWDISPAFRTLTPVFERPLQIDEPQWTEIPPPR